MALLIWLFVRTFVAGSRSIAWERPSLMHFSAVRCVTRRKVIALDPDQAAEEDGARAVAMDRLIFNRTGKRALGDSNTRPLDS